MSSEFGFLGWSVEARPSSSRCPWVAWGMPTFLNHLVAESIVHVLEHFWQHAWVQMVAQRTHVPSRLTKGLCQSSTSQWQIGIYLSQVVFLAHHELCSCPRWMKHLPYSWRGVRRMRGVFHICMILQISENSVAVKNIISKILVLFRREISLSTYKEKKKPNLFHFIVSSVQHCYNLSIIL